MKNVAIGIDLGGTNCRVGIVNSDGKILEHRSIPVGSNRTQKEIAAFLKEVANDQRLTTNDRLLGIGIGAPGIVDFERGIVVSSPHYSEWQNFPLRDELSKACGLPVLLDNDANMIAVGESFAGAGRGLKNFIMVTLGTGIGGGIVINGEIFHGDAGFAGEIGHLVLEFNGKECECGGRGCFETIISGPASAIKDWKEFGRHIGAGLASLANVTGIFSFVIGGGISNAWESFIPSAKEEIAVRTYKQTSEKILLKRAELGDSAGVIGSARELFKTLQPKQ